MEQKVTLHIISYQVVKPVEKILEHKQTSYIKAPALLNMPFAQATVTMSYKHQNLTRPSPLREI